MRIPNSGDIPQPRAAFARKRGHMARSKYQQAIDSLQKVKEHTEHALKYARQEKRVPLMEILRVKTLVDGLEDLISIKDDQPERPRKPRPRSVPLEPAEG